MTENFFERVGRFWPAGRRDLHWHWDVSRTGARGGVRLTWEDETGWAYAELGPSIHDVLLEAPVTPLHRVFAAPDDVADVAEGLAHHWHTPHGEYGAEWDRASQVRTAIENFRQLRGS